MRIAICASMYFSREILAAKKELEAHGLEVVVQDNVDKYVSGERTNESKWEKLETDPIKAYFEEIKNADGILVLNYSKNMVKNYVGGNTLIEMAFAHVLGKKIFMMNPAPQMAYSDEIHAMKPIIINGDYSKIQ